MTNVHTLKDISGGSSLSESPLNRYPLGQVELIEQLSCAKKDRKTAINWGNQVADKYEALDEENKCIRDDLNRFQKDNDALNDEIKHIQYSLDQTITERDDLKHQEYLVAEKYKVLDEENKCIREDLNQFQKENKRIQSELDQSKKDNDALIEVNRHIQDSQDRTNTRAEELYKDNNELRSQISSQQKFYTELTVEHLKELQSLRFMVKSLENRLNHTAKEVSLKDSDIASYKVRIKELKVSLEKTLQDVSLKDSNNAFYRDRIEELKQNMENSYFLISRLKTRVNDLEDELKQHLKLERTSHSSSSDTKHGGTTDETTCSEISAGTSDQKLAEQNITSALPSIAVLGAEKALANDEYIIPPMLQLTIFVLVVVLIVWYVYKRLQRLSGSEKVNPLLYL